MICVTKDVCFLNEIVLECSGTFIIAIVILFSMSRLYFREKMRIELKDDDSDVIFFVAKVWGILLLLLSIMSWWNNACIENIMLAIQLSLGISSIFLQWNGIFQEIFSVTSSISWFGMFRMLAISPSGYNIRTFMQLNWVLSFFMFSSIVILGGLGRCNAKLEIYRTVISFTMIVMIWSSSVPFEIVCSVSNICPTLVSNYLRINNDNEERLGVLTPLNWVYYLAVMAILHTIAFVVLKLVSDDVRNCNDSDDTQCNYIEGKIKGDYSELPSDSVEIDINEAILLHEGKLEPSSLRFRK